MIILDSNNVNKRLMQFMAYKFLLDKLERDEAYEHIMSRFNVCFRP